MISGHSPGKSKKQGEVKMEIKTESAPGYNAGNVQNGNSLGLAENRAIMKALKILETRVSGKIQVSSFNDVSDYLIVRAGAREDQFREIFGCIFLDSRHRIICTEDLFSGSLSGAAVYPREIARAALRHNAGAVILFHNHPSGKVNPSKEDEILTQSVKKTLELVDVRVLDHVITGGGKSYSFASNGKI